MTNSSFLKRTIFALFALSAVLFVSCDDDFNLLGADVVGDDIHSDMIKEIVEVVAYDRPTGAVQSNNMAENRLGIYDNPVFGKTVSHFVTQIVMAAENPTLYSPVVDSAYIYIPYYSAPTGDVTADGTTLYELDPAYLHGTADAKFNLQILRNGYLLRDSDPGASDNIQRYYSDDKAMVEDLIVGEPLINIPDFSFSPTEVKIDFLPAGTDVVKVAERKAPGMFAYFPNPAEIGDIFFSEENRGNLLNNTIFKNYFRGLYFKVTQKTSGGAVVNTPKFSEGTITFKIHDYEARTDGVAGPDTNKPRISKTITFNLKGNTINFFESTYSNPAFTSAITTSDAVNGDDKLYLKGGAGSMAVINLDDAKLNELRQTLGKGADNNILINEANIVFYIDEAAMAATSDQPLRLYLYDLKNRKPIIDYSMDGTTSLVSTKLNKSTYDGIGKIVDGKKQYKIRVTNHIKNIIKGDSTNVKLGLVVTDNIMVTANYNLKTPFTEGDTEVKDIPYGSVQEIFGTVLFGSNIPVDNENEDNKVKLEIFYSKPKE